MKMKVSKHISKRIDIENKGNSPFYYIYLDFKDLNRKDVKLALDYSFHLLQKKVNKQLPFISHKKSYLDTVSFLVSKYTFCIWIYWNEDPIYLRIFSSRKKSLYIETRCEEAMIDFRKPAEFVIRASALLKFNLTKKNVSMYKDYKEGIINIYENENIKNKVLNLKNIKNFMLKHCEREKLPNLHQSIVV